jgi:hypothetical protein
MKFFAHGICLLVAIHATTYARYLLVELKNKEQGEKIYILSSSI